MWCGAGFSCADASRGKRRDEWVVERGRTMAAAAAAAWWTAITVRSGRESRPGRCKLSPTTKTRRSGDVFRDVGREMDDGLECWLSVSRVRSTGGRVDEARPKARRGVGR